MTAGTGSRKPLCDLECKRNVDRKWMDGLKIAFFYALILNHRLKKCMFVDIEVLPDSF